MANEVDSSVPEELGEGLTALSETVFVTKRCLKELGGASAKVRAQIKVIAEQIDGVGGENIPPERFVFEGRFGLGVKSGKDVAIYAIKGWQFRVYGGFISAKGIRYFIGVLGVEKKKQKADPEVLKRAGKLMSDFEKFT